MQLVIIAKLIPKKIFQYKGSSQIVHVFAENNKIRVMIFTLNLLFLGKTGGGCQHYQSKTTPILLCCTHSTHTHHFYHLELRVQNVNQYIDWKKVYLGYHTFEKKSLCNPTPQFTFFFKVIRCVANLNYYFLNSHSYCILIHTYSTIDIT